MFVVSLFEEAKATCWTDLPNSFAEPQEGSMLQKNEKFYKKSTKKGKK